MSHTERFLRDAIADAPDDPAPRLVYADWLEEHEDDRAALVQATAEANMIAALRHAGADKRLWHAGEPSSDDLRDLLEQPEFDTIPWAQFAADCAERACLSQRPEWVTQDLRDAIELARAPTVGANKATSLGGFLHAITSTIDRQYSLAIYVARARIPDPAMIHMIDRDYGLEASQLAMEVITHSQIKVPRPGSLEEFEQLFVRDGTLGADIPPRAIEAEVRWQVLRACEYQAFGESLSPVTRPRAK